MLTSVCGGQTIHCSLPLVKTGEIIAMEAQEGKKKHQDFQTSSDFLLQSRVNSLSL